MTHDDPQDWADEDDDGVAWLEFIVCSWQDVLSDPREDIYDLTDGEPIPSSPSKS